jgi:DNA-binding NarL/FixJ family response regulator
MTTRSEDAMARKVTIEEMWAAGHTMQEIAYAIGSTEGAVAVAIVEMRRSPTWDVPYRNKPMPS